MPYSGEVTYKVHEYYNFANYLFTDIAMLNIVSSRSCNSVMENKLLLTGEDRSVLQLDVAPMCQLSLALRHGHFCQCSALSASGKWLAYSDQKSSRLFQLGLVV